MDKIVEDIEIWRAAEQMRKLYGAVAAVHAAMRADKFLDQGDVAGFEAWRKWVVTAVNKLERVILAQPFCNKAL